MRRKIFFISLITALLYSNCSSACGNWAGFFGCAPDLFYELIDSEYQILSSLKLGSVPDNLSNAANKKEEEKAKIIIPPQEGQIKVPPPLKKILKAQKSKNFKTFPSEESCPSGSPDNYEPIYHCSYNALYAEMFSQYMERHPIRNLFDGDFNTSYREGLFGDGTGSNFYIGSNEGALQVIGLEVANGCQDEGKNFNQHNRVKKLGITIPSSKAEPLIPQKSWLKKGLSGSSKKAKDTAQRKTNQDGVKSFTVPLSDTPDLQKVELPPHRSQVWKVTILESYPGQSKNNDTCLSELRFILKGDKKWPDPQAYWLESIAGSIYSKDPVKRQIITDNLLSRGTPNIQIVNDKGKIILNRHYPEEAPDMSDENSVDASANLISKQGLWVSGALATDLKNKSTWDLYSSPSKKEVHRKYEGLYPIRFSPDGNQLCLYDRREQKLLVLKLPKGEILREDKLSAKTKEQIKKNKYSFPPSTVGDTQGRQVPRPGFILYPLCKFSSL